MRDSVIAALQLYQYGLTPIPLHQKTPLIDAWSTRFINQPLNQFDIINGLKKANGKVIRYDKKNIGIVAGSASDCIVLDIDDMSLLKKLKALGTIPKTWTAKSNRGIHLYFKYNKDIKNFTLWDGIDVLTDKKQIVAPPSVHPSGIKYKWVLSPKDVDKAELPKWLIDLLKDNSNQSKNISTPKSYSKWCNYKSNELNNALQKIDWLHFYSQFTKNIRGRGEWLSSTCPFHDDTNNSFGFNRLNGAWKCFAGCGSGNGFKVIQRIYNLTSFQTAKIIKGEDIYL